METEEEHRLTKEARSDPEAFARLYDEFLPVIYRYVLRRVTNKEVAEDITSQTFEKALRSIKTLREGSSFKIWMYKIAGNSIIDYYRSRSRRQTYSLTEAKDVVNGKSEQAVESIDTRVSVLALLEDLPETQKTALVLHFLEGLSIDDMAPLLGTSSSACYMRVYRATKALAEMLEDRGITGIDDVVYKT